MFPALTSNDGFARLRVCLGGERRQSFKYSLSANLKLDDKAAVLELAGCHPSSK
jgi:hypothetical protein